MASIPKDTILYELFVYSEWRPDPDFIRGEISSKHTTPQSTLGYFVNFLKPQQTLVDSISSFIDQLQPWQICLGDDRKVLAVLQDAVLEIRTRRGNYSTIVARAGVPRDAFPQWRKMVWSPDCSMLAIAHSSGVVSFYDLMANNLFDIASESSQSQETTGIDTTHAMAGIVFLTSRVVDRKWSYEVLLIDYKGVLRSYFVSPTDGYVFNHKFTIDGGVSTVTYHTSHNIIFITGLPSLQGKESKNPWDYGLRSWRLLNDSPFYKLNTSLEKDVPLSLTSWISNYRVPSWTKASQNIITKAVPSPNGSLLACLHMNGSVSIWQLPSLRCSKIWSLSLQPNFDAQSPLVLSGKLKVWPPFHNELSESSPIDINWWNHEAVIISRLNGSITICSTSDLHNILGDSPEFLQGHPQISSTFDNGFLSLECEAMLVSAKKLRRNSDSNDDSNKGLKEMLEADTGADTSDDEKLPFARRSTEVIKTALYIVTDMERFQPKPKKLNLLSRIYRLLCLRATTPEDLYARKIENADFTEALTLANTYNLDKDLVYQQQWRSSKVSHQSIKDYLGKISKKMWVIEQCRDRVPETLQAAKELLEFGLEITNEEILKGYEPEYGTKLDEKSTLEALKPEDLSTHKTEILQHRYSMFFYFDRLEIYKAVIESEYCTYSSDEYDRLRINSIRSSAIDYAKEGRVQALTCLWPHLPELSDRLTVLQNIPETLDPIEYMALLPTNNDNYNLFKKCTATTRSSDWCEKEIFSGLWTNCWNDDVGLYDTIDKQTSTDTTLPSTNLTDWYINRAREIETLSGLPKNALSLISLAQKRNVPGLDTLKYLLVTLITLLYDLNVEEMSLARLEGCSKFQVANYLMSKSTEESVIEDVQNILFPYLESCEKLCENDTLKDELFKEYVVNVSKKDLNLPITILQGASDLNLTTKQCLSIVNDCLLAQDSLKQLSLCFNLLDAIPKESDNDVVPSFFVRALDEMERFLKACVILDYHEVSVCFSQLKSVSSDPTEALSLLTTMGQNASNKVPTLSSNDWNELLADILDLHTKVFCCVDIELCYEIYASALLSSSNNTNIRSARQVLNCHPHGESVSHPVLSNNLLFTHKINVSQKISYQRSVALVLEAAKKYFNSASSISDVSLTYAWNCLKLIKEGNDIIEDEKDLLSALKIIDEFELSIVPIQVRLYTPKIGLVEDCLNSSNRAHKEWLKLFQLAKLLRISADDEVKRKVIILSLCAEKAADNEDFDSVVMLCSQLVREAGGRAAGAEGERAARRLGAEPRLAQPLLRRDLLDIALLHTHAQHIENLIQIRSSVEAELLQCEISNLINVTSELKMEQLNLQDSMESTDDEYVDALTSPLVENKGFVAAAHAVGKYVHKNLLINKNYWKEVLNVNWMNEKHEANSTEEKMLSLEDSKIACHTFYSSLHTNCHISNFSTHYDKFTTPEAPDKQLVLLQTLIRTYLLQESYNYGNLETDVNKVLIQCAERMLEEDTAVFISQMLCAAQHHMYTENPPNITLDSSSVNSMLYFNALLNYLEMHHVPDGAFFLSPVKLVSDMMNSILKLPKETLNSTKNGILYCVDRYIELLEGEKLKDMGCDLDIRLFINDNVYREEAIINCARTLKNDTFKKAMEMAKKFNIDEQEIVLAHLSCILLNYNSLGFTESNTFISEPSLVNALKTRPEHSIERLQNDVWVSLDGNDYQGLILYFNAINNISNNYATSGLSSIEHVKLIKKVKSACSNLNYKYLINSPAGNDLVDSLLPYLTKENIGLVAKLLRSLPSCLNIDFNASSFYRQWLTKHFFNIPENMQSSKKWMQQYRECSGYFNKLKKEDMLLLVKELLFSLNGLEKLPAKTRIQIAYQTGEYCQQEQNNDENKHNLSKNEKNWDDIGEEISKWGEFLESFHSDTMKNIIQDSEDNHLTWRALECSRGDKSEILHPLQMLLTNKNISTKNVKLIVETLSQDLQLDDVFLQNLQIEHLDMNVKTSIVERIIDLKTENIKISQEVLDKIKPFSKSPLLSSRQRLGLMALYKTESDFKDTKMLTQITTEIISNTWSEDELIYLKDLQLSDDTVRCNLFIKLIKQADSWDKLNVLVDLINMWPASISLDQKENPCLPLIVKLLDVEQGIEDNIPLLNMLMEKNNIMENDIQWIISDEHDCHIIGKIWLCLLSKDELINKTALPKILSNEKDILENDQYIDDNLISLILKKGLFTSIVKTCVYPKCVQFLLKIEASQNVLDSPSDCQYTLDMAINDLLAKNYWAEAGSLKLTVMGVPNSLKGFSQALKIASNSTH